MASMQIREVRARPGCRRIVALDPRDEPVDDAAPRSPGCTGTARVPRARRRCCCVAESRARSSARSRPRSTSSPGTARRCCAVAVRAAHRWRGIGSALYEAGEATSARSGRRASSPASRRTTSACGSRTTAASRCRGPSATRCSTRARSTIPLVGGHPAAAGDGGRPARRAPDRRGDDASTCPSTGRSRSSSTTSGSATCSSTAVRAARELRRVRGRRAGGGLAADRGLDARSRRQHVHRDAAAVPRPRAGARGEARVDALGAANGITRDRRRTTTRPTQGCSRSTGGSATSPAARRVEYLKSLAERERSSAPAPPAPGT